MKSTFLIVLLFILSCSKENSNSPKPYYLNQEPPNDIPKIFGTNIVSVVGRFDMGISISTDGEQLAFGVAHESDSTETCIYFMNYVDGAWTSPDKTLLSNNVNTFFPMFGPHGDTFYFAKSSENENTELWVADLENNKPINPKSLNSTINSSFREAGHGISKKGSFYFTSNRDQQEPCCGDIYVIKSNSGNIGDMQKVQELSTSSDEESLFLSHNEDYIIIQSWQVDYESKHDLYISYKTKSGTWTKPERLHEKINSREIEQRPFVSPDNEFLFYSRTSILKQDGKEKVDSDIYWVSTKNVFKPFVYNDSIQTTSIKYNESFQINLPKDLFKDIDSQVLSYQATLYNGSPLPTWLTFYPKKLSFEGIWESKESLIIKITATDDARNTRSFLLNPKV